MTPDEDDRLLGWVTKGIWNALVQRAADLAQENEAHTARIAALEASLWNAAELVRVLTGPDDSIAQAFIDEARALIGEKP